MRTGERSASAPPSWSATQRFLEDLDRDSVPVGEHTGNDHSTPPPDPYPPLDPSADGPQPTELDVVDIDEPSPARGNDEQQAATVNLDEPLGSDYIPATADDEMSTTADDDDGSYGELDLHHSDAWDDTEPQHDSADPESPTDEPADPPRFNKSVAVGFVATVIVATIVITATLLGMRTEPTVSEQSPAPTAQISVAPAPAPPPADTGADAPIPYTASSSCPPGSTAAQSVAGSDPTRAWVCVRNGADGQVLQIELGRPMVVTAISITPGWVGADATGADQWLQHRVLTRVQWILFNGGDNPTVVAHKTGNVRGEAVQPMPNGAVLASKITMIVQQTSRAPADTGPATSAAAPPGPLTNDILGDPLDTPPSPSAEPGPPLPGLGEQNPTDPADNTFAVSAIKILGHPPR